MLTYPNLLFILTLTQTSTLTLFYYYKHIINSKYYLFIGKGLGTALVITAIRAMELGNCDEVVLETEITNKGSIKLYENLGFVKHKRLFK